MVINAQTIAGLNLRRRPYLPQEQVRPCRIARLYMLAVVKSLTHIGNDAATDIWVVDHVVSNYYGGKVLDLEVELEPPELVPIAGGAGSGAGRDRAAAKSGVGAGQGASRRVGSGSSMRRGGSSAGPLWQALDPAVDVAEELPDREWVQVGVQVEVADLYLVYDVKDAAQDALG